MNKSTPLNSELLSADARGRKHIPVAVFAVIMIHIVLFVVLLIAAGCRSSLRAKKIISPTPRTAERQPAIPAVVPPAITPAIAQVPIAPALFSETVMATEPVVEPEPPRAAVPSQRPVTQMTQKNRPTPARAAVKSAPARAQTFYVVKEGDTLEKIAKRHGMTIQAVRTVNKIKNDRIRPGQKLQLSPDAATKAAPFQVRSIKAKRSNEA